MLSWMLRLFRDEESRRVGMPEDDQTERSSKGSWFPATHWTDIIAARREGSASATDALNRLCSVYWYPIYAYIRRRGTAEDEAKALAQSFFYHVIERNLLGSADRAKGKFRSFLLGALNYFLSNRYEFEHAQKRGGGVVFISLDDKTPEGRYALEPLDRISPEKLFYQRWARDLLGQASLHPSADYGPQDQEHPFAYTQPFLS